MKPAFQRHASLVKKKKILFLVTEDWYFISHRLPMAHAAREAGLDVHVACKVGQQGDAIKARGFTLHPLDWKRSTRGPSLSLELWRLRRLIKKINPDILHNIALKPVILGSLCSLRSKPIINSLAGLGSSFTDQQIKTQIKKSLLKFCLFWMLRRSNTLNLVQNRDDEAFLRKLLGSRASIRLIPGSGVDAESLRPLPEPNGPTIRIGIASRVLADKGFRTLIAAFRQLKDEGSKIELWIAGTPDPDNRTSIPIQEWEAWSQIKGVRCLGFVSDIEDFWQNCHIAALPSLREGLPKSLLEASACGRPIVTTDVPGCREVVTDQVNGLLVLPNDPNALANAIQELAENPAMRRRLGHAGRLIVEARFSSTIIHQQMRLIYELFSQNGKI